MMDFIHLSNTRQSCRNFSSKPVSKEDLLTCLEAARLAPSACNSQPYHIYVCTGETAAAAAKTTQTAGMNKFTSQAPCLLVITEENYNATAAIGSRRKDQDYRSVDIGLAAAQICLCATTLGLSTCMVGWFNEKELSALLNTKSRIRLVIALGYAAEEDKLRTKKRKSLDELVSFVQ
ncbi:MAG: NAD(P)H nitroreductase [Ruminococcaceae bacterium]|nr:NAD(P)H nitroreductase [Oscillospiraceae bacterium]